MTDEHWTNATVINDVYEVERDINLEADNPMAWRHRLISFSGRNREWTNGRPPSGPHSKAG